MATLGGACGIQFSKEAKGMQTKLPATLSVRGFLPADDPRRDFPEASPFSLLDEVGRNLPDLLEDSGFRRYASECCRKRS